MSTKTDFKTPAGRLVQGNVWVGKDTDKEGAPLVYKTGTMAGQPRKDYFFSIAIAKTDPGLPAFMASIAAQAHVDFPHLVGADGACSFPGFSWKRKDGDDKTPDVHGKCLADKQGFPGCYVFSFSGGNAPGVYKRDSTGRIVPIVNQEEVKRGYYVQVFGNTKGNGNADKPGMYMNHSMILFVAFGEEITSGPDADTAFGAAEPLALPAGASVTPLAAQAPATPAAAPVNASPQPPAVAAVPVAPVPVAAVPVAVAAVPVAAVPVAVAPVPVAAVPVAVAPVPVAAVPVAAVPVAAVPGLPPVQ